MSVTTNPMDRRYVQASTGTDVLTISTKGIKTCSTPPYCDGPRHLLHELLCALREAFR